MRRIISAGSHIVVIALALLALGIGTVVWMVERLVLDKR